MLPNGTWAPTLLVMTGPLAGKRLYVRNGFLIGKQPGCDLQIDDQYASSQHCQIGMDAAGNCKLYDRGSTNGTLLNGVPVTEAVLQNGVTIRIGGVEIRFLTQ
jgi:pSer/pThr/pTyr-binding forkhead associated (FHA) protein